MPTNREEEIVLHVFGTNEPCGWGGSLPSPVEVYETLETAVRKKYGDRVRVVYVDMDEVIPDDVEEMADRIAAEDRWLPVIALGQSIIGEGVLRLPDVWKALQRRGWQGGEEGNQA